jgi:hypothetical protein
MKIALLKMYEADNKKKINETILISDGDNLNQYMVHVLQKNKIT